jgi:hypothetical protein
MPSLPCLEMLQSARSTAVERSGEGCAAGALLIWVMVWVRPRSSFLSFGSPPERRWDGSRRSAPAGGGGRTWLEGGEALVAPYAAAAVVGEKTENPP